MHYELGWSSSLLISMCVSPLVMWSSMPVIKALKPKANDGNRMSSPTAVSTLPSISPCGGRMKPVIMSITLTAKQMMKHHWQNAHFCSVGFVELMSHIIIKFIHYMRLYALQVYFASLSQLCIMNYELWIINYALCIMNYELMERHIWRSSGQRTFPILYNIFRSQRYTHSDMSYILRS